MRVLVTGAAGFLGSHVVARLRGEGADVAGVVRPGGRGVRRTDVRWIEIDIAAADSPRAWRAALEGADAVVNCAGVFADTPMDSTARVHVEGVGALFDACAAAGVRRVVHVSAAGVEDRLSAFARTKLAADERLMALDLDWVILRPSIILGAAASGGGALIRGLAASPVLPADPRAGPLQVVRLEDVVDTVARLLRPEAPTRIVLDVVGPEPLSLTEVVARYRAWLGWPPARVARAPDWLMATIYRLGDAAGGLGWRSPVRTQARQELARGATGRPDAWEAVMGRAPMSLAAALAATPASSQERRFAQLYFLTPLVIAVTAAFWIATGVTSLTFGYPIGVGLLEEAGLGALSGPSVIAGGAADLLIGMGIAWRPTARAALLAAIGLSMFYAVAGTIALPRLWLDPIGPMLKIWPLLVLNIVALILTPRR